MALRSLLPPLLLVSFSASATQPPRTLQPPSPRRPPRRGLPARARRHAGRPPPPPPRSRRRPLHRAAGVPPPDRRRRRRRPAPLPRSLGPPFRQRRVLRGHRRRRPVHASARRHRHRQRPHLAPVRALPPLLPPDDPALRPAELQRVPADPLRLASVPPRRPPVAAAYGRVFSYCLGDRMFRAKDSSSYLVFSRTPELPSTAFTPLRTNRRRPSLYYVDMVGFSVGGEPVPGFSKAGLALDPATGRGGIAVNSGTAISRFARDAYAAVRDAFNSRAAAGGMRKLDTNFSVFDACYDLRGRGHATVRVPSIVLHFAGGMDMALPPANYLVPVEGSDRRTYFCLGLQAADDGLNVLGNVQQQGFGVVFDVELERIGFAPNGCSA